MKAPVCPRHNIEKRLRVDASCRPMRRFYCSRCASESAREWERKNPDALAAHEAVKAARRAGKLQPLPCKECGAEPAEAHHEDYARPLLVEWMCRSCHRRHHRDLRRAALAEGDLFGGGNYVAACNNSSSPPGPAFVVAPRQPFPPGGAE